MKEYYELLSGPSKHFVFGTAKEVCDHIAKGLTYKVIENYFDASENKTFVRLDVPALHKELAFYVMKVSRSCGEDFCF